MFTHFNFWYVIAPLGAIVTALVGYNRSTRSDCNRFGWLQSQSSLWQTLCAFRAA